MEDKLLLGEKAAQKGRACMSVKSFQIMGWKAAGHPLGCLKDAIFYYCGYSVCSDSNTKCGTPPLPRSRWIKTLQFKTKAWPTFLKCSVPGELPLGPHQVFYLLHLFYSNVPPSGPFCCKQQPFACDRSSHLCIESNRSQDELDLSLMCGGLLCEWRTLCGVSCRVVGGFEALTAMENVESNPKTDKPKVRVRGFKFLCWVHPKIDFLPGHIFSSMWSWTFTIEEKDTQTWGRRFKWPREKRLLSGYSMLKYGALI